MQDRQARDKDPFYSSSSYSESSDENDEKSTSSPIRKESYQTLQTRREAAVILDNPELLFMYSNARNDSLAGTRHHFTKILCGYADKEEESNKKQKSSRVPIPRS